MERIFRAAWVSLLITVFLMSAPAQSAPYKNKIKFIVRMKSGASHNPFERLIIRKQNMRRLASDMSVQSSRIKTQKMEHLGLLIVECDEEDAASLKEELNFDPKVHYVEQDVQWKLAAYEGENDPSNNTVSPQMEDLLGLDHNSPNPYVSNNGQSPVVVAIIDTGMNVNHPYLSSALHVNSAEANGINGVDDDGNGYIDDVYGANVILNNGNVSENGTDHGTHVASLIKAVRDQSITLHQEARGIELLPIRFIDSSGQGSTTGAIKALDYAASRGAKVVNMSWGASGTSSYSQALFETLADLYLNDISLVAAAGNNATNNDNTPFFPASLNASIPGLISTASVTPTYSGGTLTGVALSSFSNYGKSSVDVAAVGSYKVGPFAVGVFGANAHYTSQSNWFIRKEGTSMASPIVAGIAAVMRAVNSSLTNYDVKQLILSNSVPLAGIQNWIQSGGYAHAADSIQAALTATSSGTLPSVSQPSYSTSTSDAGSISGCGTVRNVNSQTNPFGGNSLYLMLFCYALLLLGKRFKSLRSEKISHTA